MKLIGYIETYLANYFAIPVYQSSENYFVHKLSSDFTIESFHRISSKSNIIKDKTIDQEYEIADIAPLIYKTLDNIFVGIANLLIYELKEYKEKHNRYANDYLMEELIVVSEQLNVDIEEEIDQVNMDVIRSILKEKNNEYDISFSNVLVSENENVEFDYKSLRKAVLILRCVNHKLRAVILDKISSSTTNLTIETLSISMRMQEEVLLQHIAIFLKAGILFESEENVLEIDSNRLEKISRIAKALAGSNWS